jgi:hypothetical protein
MPRGPCSCDTSRDRSPLRDNRTHRRPLRQRLVRGCAPLARRRKRSASPTRSRAHSLRTLAAPRRERWRNTRGDPSRRRARRRDESRPAPADAAAVTAWPETRRRASPSSREARRKPPRSCRWSCRSLPERHLQPAPRPWAVIQRSGAASAACLPSNRHTS